MKDRPIFILAGNTIQAEYIARYKGLSKKEWTYLYDISQIRGHRNSEVWLYGHWFEHPSDMIDTLFYMESLMFITLNRIRDER